jgi:hypothetical protein
MIKYCIHVFIILFWYIDCNGQSLNLSGKGYDMHTELNWNSVPSADRYEIWRKAQAEPEFALLTSTRRLRWIDWTGRDGVQEDLYKYYIKALTVPGATLATSDTLDAFVSSFDDGQMLDMVQEYTFRYFYEYGHPTSGMARERFGSGDIVTTGGTGFGIMALIVGIHRGYITREEGVNRLLKIVSFLQFADRFHGAFPHWMNGKTGDVIPFSTFDNGGDIVETAFLIQGLLCARQYFDLQNQAENTLRDVITSLWEDVEWDHYSRNNSGVIYWHWSPNYGWQMNFPLRGYNEGLIVYLLAIASPTHPVDASYWKSGWAGAGYVNGNTWYGYKLYVGPNLGGPLFFAHYSFLGFDPRGIKDEFANYYDQNHNHTMINRSWCVTNPLHFEGYGENCWGLTASDDPWGYLAHAPGAGTDNGTITPAAAIPSMPYTPAESLAALKHFYREYGADLWGEYGFYDAFNLKQDWFADSYLAIDQGPIIDMIENYRSGLLWANFMANPEIAPALAAIGFEEDITATDDPLVATPDWNIYPTVNHGTLYIKVNEEWQKDDLQLSVTDALGRKLPFHLDAQNGDILEVNLDNEDAFSGWIWITLSSRNGMMGTQPAWLQRN